MQQHHQRLLGAARGDHVVCRDDLLVVLFGIANDGFLQSSPSGAVYRISPVFSSAAQLITASIGALLLGSPPPR